MILRAAILAAGLATAAAAENRQSSYEIMTPEIQEVYDRNVSRM